MDTFDTKVRKFFWFGHVVAENIAVEGTNVHAILYAKYSIPPLQIDLQRHQSLQSLTKCMEELN